MIIFTTARPVFVGLHNQSELNLSPEQQKLYQAKKIADIYPEYYLIEVKNFDNVAKNTLDEWIYFLKNEQIKDDFTAKGLKQAQKTLDVLKMNQAERLRYEQHQTQLHHQASLYQSTYVLGKLEGKEEGREEGREEGLEIGREQGLETGREQGLEMGREAGKEEAILIMAKNMKQQGVDIATIMNVSNLSQADIDKL